MVEMAIWKAGVDSGSLPDLLAEAAPPGTSCRMTQVLLNYMIAEFVKFEDGQC